MGSHPRSVGDSNNGVNSIMAEDEFLEVLDAEIDIEIEQRKHKMIPTSCTHVEDTAGNLIPRFLPSSHPIYADVCRVVDEHMRFSQFENTIWGGSSAGASESSDSKANVWQLFFQEGNIRMYRRELEREGRVIDPLKAVHVVRGITGRELLKHFYELQYRMDWQFTLDLPPVLLDKISNDTMVLYQIIKRVWPADQRDSVFWSHIRRTSDWGPLPAAPTTSDATTPVDEGTRSQSRENVWLVVDYSASDPKYMEDPTIPSVSKRCIHIEMNVCMMARTLVKGQPPEVEGPAPGVKREDIECHVQYTATVDPGGWAPPAALRLIYKREYPRFLKTFTEYVIKKMKGFPPTF